MKTYNDFKLDKFDMIIHKERNEQDKKWGEQNHRPDIWMLILLREIGEMCDELVESTWQKRFDEMNPRTNLLMEMVGSGYTAKELLEKREEWQHKQIPTSSAYFHTKLVQCAATLKAIWECSERNTWPNSD